ncbi:MAG: hypothetical protein H6Q14_90 [Bacteroidetes bacterium]|jgi:hypothetical protein|nr:hypothetical protein [Bacteroidota bacterium]
MNDGFSTHNMRMLEEGYATVITNKKYQQGISKTPLPQTIHIQHLMLQK